MNILHVIPQFPYFGGGTIIGGHASTLYTLALTQSKSDLQLTILSYTEGCEGHLNLSEHLDVFSLFKSAKPGTVPSGPGEVLEGLGAGGNSATGTGGLY